MTKIKHAFSTKNTYNTKSTHKKTKARFSRLLRNMAWKRIGTLLIEWEWMEKQENR